MAQSQYHTSKLGQEVAIWYRSTWYVRLFHSTGSVRTHYIVLNPIAIATTWNSVLSGTMNAMNVVHNTFVPRRPKICIHDVTDAIWQKFVLIKQRGGGREEVGGREGGFHLSLSVETHHKVVYGLVTLDGNSLTYSHRHKHTHTRSLHSLFLSLSLSLSLVLFYFLLPSLYFSLSLFYFLSL